MLAGLDVLFVGVHCSVPEPERRERARGDRLPGQAAAQLQHVHAHGIYDIACDTTSTSAGECAIRIKDFLPRRPDPCAFDQLRSEQIRPGV